jgi:hypothetical protein
MRVVQGAVLSAWLLLIVSLFWDPLTPWLTEPTNPMSPFRIQDAGVKVQDHRVPNEPYAMGARIFWNMALPLLPLFFMVFGHEAWRRICPMSFVSQIPRFLKLQRKHSTLLRRTGKISRSVALIERNSWLARNALYVQLGLLFVGLTARLLFINSNRMAMAIFFIGILLCAMTVGYLWGGKSWCNYFCPVNVVQKIYTEPRGILESSPQIARVSITQSMCRTPSPEGDASACVGCTTNCGDIDLERSYWETLLDPVRRNVYYMFYGLVIGFYSYYYVYSGSWDYYFSGIWTHEAGAITRLLDPGVYMFGRPFPIPKLIAAPLFLALAAACSLGLGRLLERAYRRFRLARGKVPEAEIVNHCLSFSAYLSINTFYLFAGRPVLLLLPSAAVRCIDVLIVAATTLWFWQAIQRTPFKYRRESLAFSLLEQLKKMKVDFSRYLEGRRLEELKPDEVYVLTKVLPAFSKEQKLFAYRQILDDAISTGKTKSAVSLELLHEMRLQMNISDEEHAELVSELGLSTETSLDANAAVAQEKWECIDNYSEIVGSAVIHQLERGKSLAAALKDPALVSTINILRASFQLSDSDHTVVIARIVSSSGAIFNRCAWHLDALKDLSGARFCLQTLGMKDPRWRPAAALLVRIANQGLVETSKQLLSLLRALEHGEAALWIAHSLVMLVGDDAGDLLSLRVETGRHETWASVLHPELQAILSGQGASIDKPGGMSESLQPFKFRDVISAGLDVSRNLMALAEGAEPLSLSIILAVLAHFDPPAAAGLAEAALRKDAKASHWLLDETARDVLPQADAPSDGGDESDRQRLDNAGLKSADFSTEAMGTASKLLALSGAAPFRDRDLATLAAIASHAELRCYRAGACLCQKDDAVNALFLLQSGSASVLRIQGGVSAQQLTAGALVGSFEPAARYAASVQISSETALVLVVDTDQARAAGMPGEPTADAQTLPHLDPISAK